MAWSIIEGRTTTATRVLETGPVETRGLLVRMDHKTFEAVRWLAEVEGRLPRSMAHALIVEALRARIREYAPRATEAAGR